MPQIIEVPNYGQVEFPDDMTDEQIVAAIKQNAMGYKRTAEPETFDPSEGMSRTDKFLAGAGKGMTDLARGAGQMLGMVSDADIAESRKRDAALMDSGYATAGNIVGQAAPLTLAALIPGANTYAGAALIGAGAGAAQPIIEDESRLANIAFGAAGGVAGQKVGNVIGKKIGDKVAANALAKQQNVTRDETLKAAQSAGFKVPRSMYNPTFMSNRLESFGGKAATSQQASASNQNVVNSMARKALDLPDSAPLSVSAVEKVRTSAYAPYREVAKISKGAANALEQLKQARADTNAWFASYNRSANPEHLAKAKEFRELADVAESVIEDYATKAGKGNLVRELADARKMIAKTYTVERAMNKATGDINPRVLARMFEKGTPLSDGLDEIGRFASAFPRVAQPTSQSAGAGISALEPIAAAGYSVAGQLATGDPMGAIAGGVPLLRGPSRSLALSRMMQSQPQYGGNMLRLLNASSPSLPYLGTVGGGLLGANY